jgi:hypothetical protein
MKPIIKYNSPDREWDHCDQCIFYVTCARPEKRKGKGCKEAFSPYPYKETLKDTKPADVSVSLGGN